MFIRVKELHFYFSSYCSIITHLRRRRYQDHQDQLHNLVRYNIILYISTKLHLLSKCGIGRQKVTHTCHDSTSCESATLCLMVFRSCWLSVSRSCRADASSSSKALRWRNSSSIKTTVWQHPKLHLLYISANSVICTSVSKPAYCSNVVQCFRNVWEC